MWSRSELKERAKVNLKESYWGLVLSGLILDACLSRGGGGGTGYNNHPGGDLSDWDSSMVVGILILIMVVIIAVLAISLAYTAFVGGPFEVGVRRYLLNAAYEPQPVSGLKVVVMAFRNGVYRNVVKVMFYRAMYISLWSLLFLVPGIIKAYEYQMVPYLLAENPMMDKDEALSLSSKMMYGDKANAWLLDLSFFGWALLGAVTCGGLAVFYVSPWVNMTHTHLYLTLKGKIDSFVGSYYDTRANGYTASVQQPGGYDSNGQPVYGQQGQMQQPYYGYDNQAGQIQPNYGYGSQAGQMQQPNYGYDGQTGGNGYQQKVSLDKNDRSDNG